MTYTLQTKVQVPVKPKRALSYGDKLLSLGSCFSEHIGQALAYLGHHICINPFGVLYNPASIAQALQRLHRAELFEAKDLFLYNSLYHSRMHHGSYSAPQQEESLALINKDYSEAKSLFPHLRYLLITWGTAWVYEDAQGVVANCHKRPETLFKRRLWSVPELIACVLPSLRTMLEQNPNLQIISTVSPIRHLRDGAHGNQLSKASLLLMDEAIRSELGTSRYHYFPSYELLLDELRDYRFYAEDMTHPSILSKKIITQRFTEWLMTKETLEISKKIEKLKKQQAHRPLHAGSTAFRQQEAQLEALIFDFKKQYPKVHWA